MDHFLVIVTCVAFLHGLHTAEITLPDTCGNTHGCFYDCNHGNHCDFLVTWYHRPEVGGVAMSMKTVLTHMYEPEWFALGLSDDRTMGDDSVIECTRDTEFYDLGFVQQSYNEEHYNLPLAMAQVGLRETSGRVYDGILECNFTRTIDVGGMERIFNLDRPWYLFAARGRIQGDVKLVHGLESNRPSVSSYKVDLRDHVSVDSQHVSLLLKIHGILMLVAWVILASIGVVISRYFKLAWPHTITCGNQLWYQLHRGIMGTAVLCVIASFVIVWYEIGDFTKMIGASTFQRAHPVLGIIIMGLTLLNVLVACLRPSKVASSRPAFKYVHMFIGAVVYILALLNIGIGVTLERSGAHEFTMWLVVGFAGYILVLDFILEIHEGYLIKSGRKLQYELKVRTPQSLDSISTYSQRPPGTTFKTCVLSVHLFVCIAVGVSAVLMVIL